MGEIKPSIGFANTGESGQAKKNDQAGRLGSLKPQNVERVTSFWELPGVEEPGI